MLQRIVPGAEIDVLTRDEAERLFADLLGAGGPSGVPVRSSSNGKTDASGNAVIPFYEVPLGMAFRLTRLYIKDDAHTFGNPFTAAGAYFTVTRNGDEVDGSSLASGAGQLPSVQSTGISDAVHGENGDVLAIVLVATAALATTGVIVRFQGELMPAEGRPPLGSSGRA